MSNASAAQYAPITPEQRLALIGVFMAIFLAALDQTIVATALPKIVQDLNGTSLYAWVATSYLLTSTVALPIFGRLAELFSRKWVLLIAALIFLVGSALSGLSPSMYALIAFRGLQGIGSGGIFAVALTVIGLLFPPRERGRIQGVFGAVFGIANVLGPYLGGVITDHLSWHWVFYVNMPIGAIAVYFIARHMPHLDPESKHRFDYLGAVMLTLTAVPLLLAFSWAGQTYPWGSWQIIGLITFAVLSGILFYIAERRHPEPLFHLPLFKIPTFLWSTIASTFWGASFLGAIIFLPLYLVEVKGISATNSGLSLTPLTFGIVLGSFLSGTIASKFGRYKVLLITGNIFLLVMFLVTWSIIRVDAPLWQVWVAMIFLGLGMGPGFPIYTLAVQNAVPRERIGVASAANRFFSQVGSTVGAALMGTVLITTLKADIPKYLPASARASSAQFQSSNQVQNPSDLKKTIDTQFNATYAQLAAALKGSQKAYAIVQKDPNIPAAQKAQLKPGGIPAQVKAETNATLLAIQAALSGDATAKATVLQNPQLTAQVKALVQNPPPTAAARQAAFAGVQQGLTAAEPSIVSSVETTVLGQLKTSLDKAANTLYVDLTKGLDAGITNGVRQTYLYGAGFILLALLATFPMPDVHLKGRKEQEEGNAPPQKASPPGP